MTDKALTEEIAEMGNALHQMAMRLADLRFADKSEDRFTALAAMHSHVASACVIARYHIEKEGEE